MSVKLALVMLGLAGSLGLAGCDKPADSSSQSQQVNQRASAQVDVPPRNQDMQQILRGGRIYQQNCAVCHGKIAQGASSWRQRDAEGKFPPPPLDGSAHTWHHPTDQLIEIIKNGTLDRGGNMPAWKDRLSDQEIIDVLAWIKAQWPDEIYAQWYRNNQRAKNR